jgi:hypothetical protein
MITSDKIQELKREISALKIQEEDENIKLLLPIIRDNCIFRISWLNHLIYDDTKYKNEGFQQKLDELTVDNYRQYYFGNDFYLSWSGGRVSISNGKGHDYSSDEDYFTPLIEKCKELGLKIDFTSVENELTEKKNNIQLEIDSLMRIKQTYENTLVTSIRM